MAERFYGQPGFLPCRFRIIFQLSAVRQGAELSYPDKGKFTGKVFRNDVSGRRQGISVNDGIVEYDREHKVSPDLFFRNMRTDMRVFRSFRHFFKTFDPLKGN